MRKIAAEAFVVEFIKRIRERDRGIDVKNENFQRILLIFTENILRRRTISREIYSFSQLIRIKSYGMYLERFVSCSELSLA